MCIHSKLHLQINEGGEFLGIVQDLRDFYFWLGNYIPIKGIGIIYI